MKQILVRSTFLFIFLLSLFFPWYTMSQPGEKAVQDKKNWLSDDRKGFYNVTTFSVNPLDSPVLNGIQSICGYRLNPYIAIGGGVGLERFVNLNMYDTLSANLSLLPVFAEIRYTILTSRITPVLALQGGYKFLLNRSSTQVSSWRVDVYPPYAWTTYDEYDYYSQGGYFFTVEAGVKAKIYERLGIYLSACYSVWSVSGDHYIWTYQYLSSPDGAPKETTSHSILPSMAYNQVLLIRLGISF